MFDIIKTFEAKLGLLENQRSCVSVFISCTWNHRNRFSWAYSRIFQDFFFSTRWTQLQKYSGICVVCFSSEGRPHWSRGSTAL